MPLKELCFLLLLALLLSGCDAVLLPNSGPAVETAPPVSQNSSAEPEATLAAFMDGWNQEDFDAMYQLIARQSRAQITLENFRDKYIINHDILRFAGVDYTVRRSDEQGTTAIIDYDIHIKSPTFGEITDAERRMRLVQDDGWKVAWSSMDILKGLAAGLRLVEVPDFPQRENIYDKDNNLLAEEEGLVYSLYMNKDDVPNEASCLQTLATVTRQQLNSLQRTFGNYLGESIFHIAEIDSDQYAAYGERLAADCAIHNNGAFRKVREYRARSYYGHGIATHVVGYIGAIPRENLADWQSRGYSDSALIGRAGIESAYEEVLAGKPQRDLRIVDGGTVIRQLAGQGGAAPRRVTLTLDRRLQQITAQALADAVNYALFNWGGITGGGAIVALDVNSGAIRAIASYPSFDPHIFNPRSEYDSAALIPRIQADQRNPFRNKALAEQHTPGSVYKIVTTLAAATENVWDATKTFNCELDWSGVKYGDSVPKRYDWRFTHDDFEPAGEVTMAQALAASCNPFFYDMGVLLFDEGKGAHLQAEYAEALGFGAPTGIEGLAVIEAAGDVAPPAEITAAINNAIGQGSITVSALQMARLTALVANGGTLWQPYIVSHIGLPGEADYELKNTPVAAANLIENNTLTSEALEIAREGMCLVTTDEDFGTAYTVFSDAAYAHEVCGKTGTAETSEGAPPHAWFVAYWQPEEEPALAFAGVMTLSRNGSEVVAPIIRRILDDYSGAEQKPFPELWQEPYTPVRTVAQALAAQS